MTRQKTAEFLADCLAHMPEQTGKIKAVVNTAIAGLTRIAEGGEWPENAAWAAGDAAWAAADAAEWSAAWDAKAWAAARAADCAAASAAKSADWAAAKAAADVAEWAAQWATKAHPDPDAELARQAEKREELGLNTKQEAD